MCDAAAADAYSALMPSDNVDDETSQRPPSATTHSSHEQHQQPRRRVPPRPTSVASVDLRDPDEI